MQSLVKLNLIFINLKILKMKIIPIILIALYGFIGLSALFSMFTNGFNIDKFQILTGHLFALLFFLENEQIKKELKNDN